MIPFYKGDKYIRQCVESIIKQPYQNIEIILINDGSPDDGGEICKQLALEYPQIQYFEKENEGIGATRNKGIDLEQGEYIAFLDQDDAWAKDFLTEDVIEMIDGTHDIFSFEVLCCDEYLKRYNSNIVENSILAGGNIAAKSISTHHSAHFFNINFLKNNNIGYALTRHEDVIFMHKCYYAANSIMHISKSMLLYRNNPSSETHRRKNAEGIYVPLLRSWIGLIKWFEKNYPEDKDIVAWAKHMTCVYGIEGIEMLYQTGRSDDEVNRIFAQYPCKELMENYKTVMLSENRIAQIGEFFNDRKRFARKNRMIGIKEKIGRTLEKISIVKMLYYRKKYPIKMDYKLISQ